MPVLLVSGANTMPMFAPITERLHQRLPHAEEVIVPRAGHAMNAMNPADYNREVLAFLARN